MAVPVQFKNPDGFLTSKISYHMGGNPHIIPANVCGAMEDLLHELNILLPSFASAEYWSRQLHALVLDLSLCKPKTASHT